MKNYNESKEVNNQSDPRKEKITNKEAEKQDDTNEEEMTERSDDAGYTPEENQFADGKGTQLDGQIDKDSIKK